MGNSGRLVVSVVIAVMAGGWIALGRLGYSPVLAWAAVSGVGFTVAGWMLQRKAGAVNRFAVFAGVLVGLVGAALVSGLAVLIGLAALAVMIGYARARERRGLLGHLALAALVGLPFAYGAAAVDRSSAGVVPWILAGWLQLIHSIVTDLDRESLDRAGGQETLAVRLGRSRAAILAGSLAIAFIPISLVLPARAGYGGAYFLIALFVQLAVLVTLARLIVGRIDGVGVLLKGAMAMGAVALVAGRVT